MTLQLAPPPVFRANDNNGNPLAAGQLFTYQAGTLVPQATFTDSTGVTQNTNPVILNSRGEANIWLTAGLFYKLVLEDASGNQIWAVDQIPGGSLLTQQGIAQVLFPQTTQEAAAGVVPTNFQYQPYDIRRYGGDPTGLSLSDNALAQAIAVCGTVGGTIRFPNGTYNFANQYNLNNKIFITFQGDGGSGGGATSATTLTYTGSALSWFSITGANNIQWKDLFLTATNAFTGTYILGGHIGGADCSYCGTFNCTIGSATPQTHLNLDKCISWTSDNTNFIVGNPSVLTAAANSYCNTVRFNNCQWTQASVVPVQGGGEAVIFSSCTFEGLSTGAPGAILSLAGTTFLGLKVNGCWIGDVTTTAGTWFNLSAQAFEFSGNYISGNATGTSCLTFQATTGAGGGTTAGGTIQGNLFIGALNGISFTNPIAGQITVQDNVASSVTNPWVGTAANVTFGTLVYGPNFGFGVPAGHGSISATGVRVNADSSIEMWGSVSVTNATPAAVSFSPHFPNNAFQVQLTMVSAPSTGLETYYTGLTTSGFNANVVGAAGTTTVVWRAIGN